MEKIKDILTIDIEEDITNVIDIESEKAIQSEIESYIVTEGLGQHFTNFINQYTSNIKETGVWISGFYGSGKFLKSLGFLDDVYGYYEFNLFLDNEYERFIQEVKLLTGLNWTEIRKSAIKKPSIMKKALINNDFSEDDFNNTKKSLEYNIRNFSANKFKDELERYFEKIKDETIVFMFDEASEAISQDKFTLLDLEGISESLSSISSKVWTIAIAQEKLDDVINNKNISKSQLIKVTDRFKTKLHLESKEVEKIIQFRLLKKKPEFQKKLEEYYRKNEGLISDVTNLNSRFPTKTTNEIEFSTFYPFHKYQFDLLQKFLFSSNALVASQIAARGMIITTFELLKRQLQNTHLFGFCTSWQITTEAQSAPPVNLSKKYEDAKKILKNEKIKINGDKLLKTIHFLSESEYATTNIDNISKAFVSDITKRLGLKPLIKEALEILVEAKILLRSKNQYKITSDLEGKLLDEKNEYRIELWTKKNRIIELMKNYKIFHSVSGISYNDFRFNFDIVSDLEDDIIPSKNKNLKMTVYNLFNINEDIRDFIENKKRDTQFIKNQITIIPDNTDFSKLDKLLEDIQKFSYMAEKYSNSNDSKTRLIIREFEVIKEEKEKTLRKLIEKAYYNGNVIYLIENQKLNNDSFKTMITELQKKMINNIYSKRPIHQLSESIAEQVINESESGRLHQLFSGDEYNFFDVNGNFIGENLKVIEEIAYRIKPRYMEGKSLEADLKNPPTGYEYGTLCTALSVLFRAGRLIVKFNGNDLFAYTDAGAIDVFKNSRNFQKASFKFVSKSLSAEQKDLIVQTLLDLKINDELEIRINWNTNDFELVNAIKKLSENFITKVKTLQNTVPEFDKLFEKVISAKKNLHRYSGKTTENNYIENAEFFIESKKDFIGYIKQIKKAERFIQKNFDNVKTYKKFISNVERELQKSSEQLDFFAPLKMEFEEKYNSNLVSNFADLKEIAQKVKDEYYDLMEVANNEMNNLYCSLEEKSQELKSHIAKNYSKELNKNNLMRIDNIIQYCKARMNKSIKLDYNTECQISRFTYSNLKDYIKLISIKYDELDNIRNNIVIKSTEKSVVKESSSKPLKFTHKVSFPKNHISVKEYRIFLNEQLKQMKNKPDTDEIEF